MTKLGISYLLVTFSIMLVCWGICLVCGLFGVVMTEFYPLYVPYALGGLSPTIASFIVLRRARVVRGFKDWLVTVFDFRRGNLRAYLMVIIASVLAVLPLSLIGGFAYSMPFYLLPVLLVLMLVGGGLEEAGWRLVLQPELEKRFNYTIATLIVAVIWSLWHLPLFFIPGVSQFGANFGIFCIGIFGMSFALACIRRLTNGVALCVLLHCANNALFAIFMPNQTILGTAIAAALAIIASYIMLALSPKQSKPIKP